jgi:hypothetical protein
VAGEWRAFLLDGFRLRIPRAAFGTPQQPRPIRHRHSRAVLGKLDGETPAVPRDARRARTVRVFGPGRYRSARRPRRAVAASLAAPYGSAKTSIQIKSQTSATKHAKSHQNIITAACRSRQRGASLARSLRRERTALEAVQ